MAGQRAAAAEAGLDDWGWRIPFIGSVVFSSSAGSCAAVSTRPRRAEGGRERAPIVASLVADWLPIVRTFGIVAMTNAAYYLTFTFAVERRKSLTGGGDRSCSSTR